MSFKFKPEDLAPSGSALHESYAEMLADRCNQLLDAHVAKLPDVYSVVTVHLPEINKIAYGDWRSFNYEGSQVRARLWGIEEIKKCEHEPEGTFGFSAGPLPKIIRWTCIHCGKRLVAEWKCVDEGPAF